MKTLVILNSVLLYAVTAYIILKPYFSRMSIEVRRTFFGKKPYGVEIYLWHYPKSVSPNEAECIFGFNWRNPKNLGK